VEEPRSPNPAAQDSWALDGGSKRPVEKQTAERSLHSTEGTSGLRCHLQALQADVITRTRNYLGKFMDNRPINEL